MNGGPVSLYTSDAADERLRVDLGGRRIIKKNFFKQKTAYAITLGLVGSEMCIRDRRFIHAASNGSESYKTNFNFIFHSL